MKLDLNEQDIQEILENPAAWKEKMKQRRLMMLEDLRVDYQRKIEDVEYSMRRKLDAAKELLQNDTAVQQE